MIIQPTVTTTGTQPANTYSVRFMDYDGTMIKTNYVSSGGTVSAPISPSHQYLTFNSWNVSLTNVTYNRLVGATYNTTDGNSYLFITVNASTGLSPILYLQKYDSSMLTVNWGDGNSGTTTSNTLTSLTHTYSAIGDYIITVNCASQYSFGNGTNTTQIFGDVYKTILTKIYFGLNIQTILTSTFYNYINLSSVTISSSVTSIGATAFQGCFGLLSISLPTTITTVNTGAFQNCRNLHYAVFNNNVNSVGSNTFEGCFSLDHFKIPTSINTIPVSFLISCYSLKDIDVHSGVTTLGLNCFQNCYTLESFVLPSTVTTLQNTVFNVCTNLKDIVIYATTPPSITTTTFNSLNALAKIYVPDGSVNTYKVTTNWVSIANNIYPLSQRI